jgi:hypothetical protein
MKKFVRAGLISIVTAFATVLQPFTVLQVGAAGLPPSPPTGLQAVTPTDQAPTFKWNADSSATYHQLSRNGGGFTTTENSYYTDYGIRGTGTYVYGVESCNYYGCSAASTVTVVYNNDRPILYNVVGGGAVKMSNGAQVYARIVHTDDVGLAAAEYFVNTDPGVGQATPLTINMNGGSPGTNDFYYISNPYTAPAQAGAYKVGIRAQNTNGAWSTVIRDLMVYDIYGPKVTASRTTIVPSLANGDVLPGLTQAGQSNTASFAFNAAYDTTTQSLTSTKNSFTMNYQTGTCGNRPVNCTTFNVSTAGLGGFLMTDSQNLSRSIFESTVDVTVNGTSTPRYIRVEAIDGNKTLPATSDWVRIKIFTDANANTFNPDTLPLYQVTGRISGGTIVIQ